VSNSHIDDAEASDKLFSGQVLGFVRRQPPGASLTPDQIASGMQRPIRAVLPRVSELAAAGLIERADGRGKNQLGIVGATWRAGR
jgi:hypothetical protein